MKEFKIIAGPCSVESEDQLFSTVEAIIFNVHNIEIKHIRGGAFKPRSSPDSFQGLGEEGLKILAKAKEQFNLKIVSEMVDTKQAEIFQKYVDIIQIGTRNSQNYELLKVVGTLGKPVILKRGMSMTIKEWLGSAKYLEKGGAKVILCERGIRSFENTYRNVLDLSAVVWLKQNTDYEVIVDPSHAAGIRDMVIPLSKAAVVAGADGLLVEVHHDPDKALCDGRQSLTKNDFDDLLKAIIPLVDSENKIIK